MNPIQKKEKEQILWSGKKMSNSVEHFSYIVQVNYDAQNSFGANLRGCNLVAFEHVPKEGKLYYKASTGEYMAKCNNIMFQGKEGIQFFIKLNSLE